ncbi:hypothetical protein RchiOBHm_Chr4g0414041 [Rosa chinensis]|uniref:Uncharacterized protein n=1 Tax=Rosa chinensis TaxID=74649 RepID=A0A2P6QWD5_ROSCH|nr:hypothetical protein RchiOBHm_Chr5g0034731 [Rosa chinensis]PRQ38449.1 hypothetical protein RchiOBHm_Chr4g0414041 [Rosa chinensis]
MSQSSPVHGNNNSNFQQARSLNQISNPLLIVRASRVSAIILYCEWFLYVFGFILVKW